MAAFCITYCANSLRKMRAMHTVILGLAAGLVLAACSEQPMVEPVEVQAAQTVEEIDPVRLQALLADGNIRLIDVRRDDEVSQGMIPGAEHIMLDNFDPASLDMSDGREIVLYCRSGRRSGIAAEKLAAFTSKPAKHLQGGILGWQEVGQPISKGE